MKVIQYFLKHPGTWIVLALSLGWYLIQGLLFPSFALGMVVTPALAGGFFLLWIFLVLISPELKTYLGRMPYEEKILEAKSVLGQCEPGFRETAAQCLALSEKISQEFEDNAYAEDLALLESQVLTMAKRNAELYQRTQSFGTGDQKREMNRRLSHQKEKLGEILVSLKDFGGNLTLLDSSIRPEEGNELKYINQGLGSLIREMEE